MLILLYHFVFTTYLSSMFAVYLTSSFTPPPPKPLSFQISLYRLCLPKFLPSNASTQRLPPRHHYPVRFRRQIAILACYVVIGTMDKKLYQDPSV